MNLEQIIQATKEQMPLSRWEHTLRVRDTAMALAEGESVDLQKVELAAILHDYCKFWPAEKLMAQIKENNLPEELLLYNKELWHGPVGAEIARKEWAIEDEDILNAIRYHTTGRPGMSPLEKIIFLADYIEPGRQFPGIDKVRQMAKTNMDQALLQSLDNTITFLIEKRQKVYPLTLITRNYYLEQVMLQERS
ncbi:bis(5'-nucleosyl)-tetraphosphatase (symmetrical) YqeK [Thermoflavimicrobium dichotomicum]|uniref:bis(5'-nucleosyl)-tetraphosphatase (symmetrical) n=1 Tax=Thermoflavimicrobium dichotomicum TaxID=46223 RepID=A0A1I3NMV5_9BACL|nr:bis(5'-nucleosyl)-tetraphosphatase (symmetrical) YqeK [Thermoflavimicrobium dichotomicum]SFJ10260.1 putative HD superfamily hydrolase of NAD metabolism [Thermoflavimicrobium dichotomicum]